MRKRGTALALALALLGALALPAAAHDTRRPGQGNRISAGTYYSGYVDPDGGLWMWGRGDDGELGDGISGDRDIQTVPVKVLDNVVSVSASEGGDDGGMYTAALQADGSLWTWGNAWGGLLGNGGGGNAVGGWVEECQNVPVKILDDVAAVSCGRSSAAAVKTDGSLWMWGPVYLDGFIRVHTTPIKVMDDVAAVDCLQRNLRVMAAQADMPDDAGFFQFLYVSKNRTVYNGLPVFQGIDVMDHPHVNIICLQEGEHFLKAGFYFVNIPASFILTVLPDRADVGLDDK